VDGTVLARRRIADDSAGITSLQTLLSEHAATPDEVVIGIETDRGLLVRALRAAGYTLYAINPFAASRYRDRHDPSGGKSDPGDAKILADLVRTDRHNHRPLIGDSEAVEALQLLTRAHQRLVWERQRHANRLRNALREYYPAALAAFPDLLAPEAVATLQRAPTPRRGRRLSVPQLVSILKRTGRSRGLERRATEIQAALRTTHLEQPGVLADAYGVTAAMLARLVATFSAQIAGLEVEIAQHMKTHPDAELVLSLPGLGLVLGSRVLAEFGDDPTRYPDSKARKSAAGTAPLTRTSGLLRSVRRRTTANRWLLTPCMRWAYCSLTASPGARRSYQALRARGKTHNQALRALANRWVGILHGCLRHRTAYDEGRAWPDLASLAPQAEPPKHQDKSVKMTGTRCGSTPTIPASA
jgi:transposase